MFGPVFAGFLTGGSLIVAIGAQNAYVLRQGLIRSHVAGVVVLCAVSDVVLIAAGVGGVGAIVERHDWLVDVVRWFGVAFLLAYAALTLRRAFGSEVLRATEAPAAGESRRGVLLRAAALTWLNPHVYLDTVLLIGSIAATHDAEVTGGRWWFAVGAAVASGCWFAGLGYGARSLAPLLARPRAWLALDVVVAATMIAVAAMLALGT